MQHLNKDEEMKLFFVSGMIVIIVGVFAIATFITGVILIIVNDSMLHLFVGVRLLTVLIEYVAALHNGTIGKVVRAAYLLYRDGYVDITIRKNK